MTQYPNPGDFLLKWCGDTLKVSLTLPYPRNGRAAFRCNLGNAKVRRAEIIAETERGEVPLAKAWTDIPMPQTGVNTYEVEIPLNEVGIFSGKACFFADGSNVPEWPDGTNFHIKVEPKEIRKNNSIYTVFPRQFGSFREIVRRLPHIMDRMGFRIIQTLPPFPVPTTYAVMGEYGCPFAALDFFSVDPAMAEFDEYATPLDQFLELVDAVHARKGLFFVDLPANHTGWASTLQTHHPDWFHRAKDGKFVSPGAWGVVWSDLVELDYSNPELRAYMADVFLFWCRNGVDGFRCDAGYMIPLKTWEYIVARVREEYPDTVFMLEGLGGDLQVTDALLAEANLDWAYSEIFQTYDRGQFEWYLPQAIARSEKYGTLVHFAETHDNDRLAKGGETYAKMRVQLAALLSWQGAWGIANGVEWFCREKIDVHGKNDLNWGAQDNMVDLIAKLNHILDTNPAFSGASHLEVVTRGEGNTLAVIRNGVLILANLDTGAPARIQWDESKFAHDEAFDILSERKTELKGSLALKPGEVKCLAPMEQAKAEAAAGPEPVGTARAAKFHWQFPRDVNRDVCVPEEELVEISAPYHFRVRLVDPETGKTIRVQRSVDNKVVFDAPHYHGNGTRSRELTLAMIVYTPGKSTRTKSRFLIPPTATKAKAQLSLSGAEIRKNPEFRTVLSNGAGAASQLRVGWGELRSQYDAILAANPNPNVPSDRINLWTRTRCWLQREGYTREFDKHCQTKFTADPAGRAAKWDFTVPCGMGKEAAFSFEVSLGPDINAARIKVSRVDAGHLDVGDQVRLVFRPDIEWRSFHSTTKAYAGLEELFPRRTVHMEDGFSFRPYDDVFRLCVVNGAYHHEPQWTYNVDHSEEAARGQEGAGDLYSPGWVSADLKVGDTMELIGVMNPMNIPSLINFPSMPDTPETTTFGTALRQALELYIVKRDDLKTVIAGYPWFLDWGRDTFIFMRGMIAAGMIEDCVKILKAFAAFEENGTLPNIIYGNTAGNRDTTDAQLWFVHCVNELDKLGVDVSGLKPTCENIVACYKSGTPNGIHMDPDSGLVWSPSHFTWMDTNYPACTPRVGYPVEIQALWISALHFVGQHDLANMAAKSVEKYFKWEHGYRDCLAAPGGESARNAIPEDTIRPNQLFLVTLGICKDPSILQATEELLVPGGVRSLNAGHPLYRGRYEGDEDTCRKPAYHNGTVWAWPFPLYAEAMAEIDPRKKRSGLSLLATAVESLNLGCVGHLSEVADGDAPHAQKGCTAQAWSDSEFLRVWLKLGGK
ncbi:MAG: glycogen debranching enzyme N-terminal domain-containing protein [Kiritimatiellae bacterium]|nr:glycogen debranching enzyme N-terminal domain-containing protein [Kiritimatiellia bacterium]